VIFHRRAGFAATKKAKHVCRTNQGSVKAACGSLAQQATKLQDDATLTFTNDLFVTLPTSNFAFLASIDGSLARLGALAEWVFHQDAPTAITKLRQFAEHLAKSLAARNGLALDDRASFEEVLRRRSMRQVAERSVMVGLVPATHAGCAAKRCGCPGQARA
jgi:hypothetical protein